MDRTNDTRLANQLEKDFENKYDNIQHIARGGFGVVFSANNVKENKSVAIKMVDLKKDRNRRVLGEIKALEKLKEHAFVVNMFEHKEIGNYVYIVMELCKGGSLRQYLTQNGALDETASAFVLNQVCSAVKQMHKCNLIHRDLTTNNVLVSRVNDNKIHVKLCDFGLISDNTKGPAKTMAGTPGFMDPAVRTGGYDKSVDLYSLACMLYSMLTGMDPPTFDLRTGKGTDEARETLVTAVKRIKNLSGNVVDLMEGLMKKKFIDIDAMRRHAFFEKINGLPRSRSTSRATPNFQRDRSAEHSQPQRASGNANGFQNDCRTQGTKSSSDIMNKLRNRRKSANEPERSTKRSDSKSSRGDSGCASRDRDRTSSRDRSSGSRENRPPFPEPSTRDKETASNENVREKRSHRRSDNYRAPQAENRPSPLRERSNQQQDSTAGGSRNSRKASEVNHERRSHRTSESRSSQQRPQREHATASSSSSRLREWPCRIRGLRPQDSQAGKINIILPDGRDDEETIVIHVATGEKLTLCRSRQNLNYQKFIVDAVSNGYREYKSYESMNEGDRELYAEALKQVYSAAKKVWNVRLVNFPDLPADYSFYLMANGDCRLHPNEADKKRGIEKIVWKAGDTIPEKTSECTKKAMVSARKAAVLCRGQWLKYTNLHDPSILDYNTIEI